MSRKIIISECNYKRKILLLMGFLLYLFSLFFIQVRVFNVEDVYIGMLQVSSHLFFDLVVQLQILLLVGCILIGGYKSFLISILLNILSPNYS